MTPSQRDGAYGCAFFVFIAGTMLALALAILLLGADTAHGQQESEGTGDAPTVAVETAPEPLPALPEPPEPAYSAPPPWPLYADVTPLVTGAAARWGANASVMRRIVWCESKNGTHAATYRSDTIHRGPFQFNRATWQEQAPRYLPAGWWGWNAALIPEANVDLAAALIARGQTWRWPNC